MGAELFFNQLPSLVDEYGSIANAIQCNGFSGILKKLAPPLVGAFVNGLVGGLLGAFLGFATPVVIVAAFTNPLSWGAIACSLGIYWLYGGVFGVMGSITGKLTYGLTNQMLTGNFQLPDDFYNPSAYLQDFFWGAGFSLWGGVIGFGGDLLDKLAPDDDLFIQGAKALNEVMTGNIPNMPSTQEELALIRIFANLEISPPKWKVMLHAGLANIDEYVEPFLNDNFWNGFWGFLKGDED